MGGRRQTKDAKESWQKRVNIKAYLQTKTSATSEAVGHRRPTTFRQTPSISLKVLLENSVKAISHSPSTTPPQSSPLLPNLCTHAYRRLSGCALSHICWDSPFSAVEQPQHSAGAQTVPHTAGARRLSGVPGQRTVQRERAKALGCSPGFSGVPYPLTPRTPTASVGVQYTLKTQLPLGCRCRKHSYLLIRGWGARLAPDSTDSCCALPARPDANASSERAQLSLGGYWGVHRQNRSSGCSSLPLWQSQRGESE